MTVSPRTYERIALIAFVSLVAIVFSGAAVRLTGSGLGCPNWPTCNGRVLESSGIHGTIEYGNRLITGVVGFAVIAAALLALRRTRPC